MKALPYILLKSAKNSLLQFRNFIGVILFLFLLTYMLKQPALSLPLPVGIFDYAYLWLLVFSSIISLLIIISIGVTDFTISDAHYLFTAPIPPRKVFWYGVFKKIQNMILITITIGLVLGMIFIRTFGFSLVQTVGLFCGVIVCNAIILLISPGICSYISRNRKRKATLVSSLIALLLISVVLLIHRTSLITDISWGNYIGSWDNYIPIVGWIKGIVFSAFFYCKWDWVYYALLLSGFLAIVLRSAKTMRTDFFYEEVLDPATKRSHRESTKQEKHKGALQGHGINVVFFKHLKEARRTPLLSTIVVPLMVLSFTIFIAVALSQSTTADGSSVPINYIMLTSAVLASLLSGTMFSSEFWSKDLSKHYYVLSPHNRFQKFIWLNMFPFVKSMLNGIIILSIAGIIVGASLSLIAGCVLLYSSFILIPISAVLLFQRFNNSTGKEAGMMTYLRLTVNIALSIPGIIVVIKLLGQLQFELVYFLSIIVNIIVATVVAYSSRSILG